MAPLDPHHAVLRRQWAAEVRQLEQRRLQLLSAAAEAAGCLRRRWPCLKEVWLFGSVLDSQRFRRHSDIDLAVEGLAPADQSEAMGLVEQVLDRNLETAGEPGCSIDLVRLEDLDPHWRQRIRQRGLRLA